MTDTETLNEQLFCTMFSTTPNVPVEKRAANHHLPSFRETKARQRSKRGEAALAKKAIMPVNSSHAIRNCCVTSLSKWTNSYLRGLEWAAMPPPP